MSNTFPCVDFDIDTNTWRVDTGHAFVGQFLSENDAKMHCVRIAQDKLEHDRNELVRAIFKSREAPFNGMPVSLVDDVVDLVIKEGWRKP